MRINQVQNRATQKLGMFLRNGHLVAYEACSGKPPTVEEVQTINSEIIDAVQGNRGEDSLLDDEATKLIVAKALRAWLSICQEHDDSS